MKKKTAKRARSHHSEILDKLLALSKPEELERTQNRMMLAAKIYDVMTAKGIGKKQLAEKIGCSPSVITKWLSGKHNFTVDTLTDIQRVLGVRLLALGEKQVVQNEYRITINVAASYSQPQKAIQPTGRSFSLLSTRTDKTRTSEENLKRKIAFA